MFDVARVNTITVSYINKGCTLKSQSRLEFHRGMEVGYGTNQASYGPSLGQRFKTHRLFAKVDDAFPGKTSCCLSTSGSLAPAIEESLRHVCK